MKILFSHLFPAQFLTASADWKEAWSYKSFRQQFLFTFAFILIIGVFISQFFNYIQAAPGYRMNDLLLNELRARNMSSYIFLLIYSVVLLSVINLITSPLLFLKCLRAYCLLLAVRIFCLYMIPLEPAQSIIPLEDPFTDRFFYNGSVITKDLFFSGHVSTMALLSFVIPFRPLKYFFIAATIVVGILILVQHVHYTVDVITAPLFSWLCYSVVSRYGGANSTTMH